MRKNLALITIVFALVCTQSHGQVPAPNQKNAPPGATNQINTQTTSSAPKPKSKHLEMFGLQHRIRAYTIEAIAIQLNSNTYQKMGVRDCSQQKSFELLNDKLTFVEQMVGTWKAYKSFKMGRKLEEFRDKMIKMCCGPKTDKAGKLDEILEKSGLIKNEKHQRHQKRNRDGSGSVPMPDDDIKINE